MDFSHVMIGVTGIVLYVLIPGMALSLAVFPRKEDIGLVERLGISLFFGIATPAIQYFNDKNFYVPINQTTTIMTLTVLTILGLAVWQARLKAPRKEAAKSPAEAA